MPIPIPILFQFRSFLQCQQPAKVSRSCLFRHFAWSGLASAPCVMLAGVCTFSIYFAEIEFDSPMGIKTFEYSSSRHRLDIFCLGRDR